MKSAWVEIATPRPRSIAMRLAASHPELALRVDTAPLLGGDPKLCCTAAGTPCQAPRALDRPQISPSAPMRPRQGLRLADGENLSRWSSRGPSCRRAARIDMVEARRSVLCALCVCSAPTCSIRWRRICRLRGTLLHALPAADKYVDHTHADSRHRCRVVDQVTVRSCAREACYGKRMVPAPYATPGFRLAVCRRRVRA